MRKTLSAVTFLALLAGCGVSPAGTYNGLPVTVCGTRAEVPVRVADDRCTRNDADVQWFTAANPPALDSSDRTEIGEELDDDYLEYDTVDRPRVVSPPRTSARPTPRSTATPRTSRAAPSSNPAPQRRSTPAPQRRSTTTR